MRTETPENFDRFMDFETDGDRETPEDSDRFMDFETDEDRETPEDSNRFMDFETDEDERRPKTLIDLWILKCRKVHMQRENMIHW